MSSALPDVKMFRTARKALLKGLPMPPDVVSAMLAVAPGEFGDAHTELMANVIDDELVEWMDMWGVGRETLVEDFLSNRAGSAGRLAHEYLSKVEKKNLTLGAKFLRALRELRGPLTGARLTKLIGASGFRVRSAAGMFARGKHEDYVTHQGLTAMMLGGLEHSKEEYFTTVRGASATSTVPARSGTHKKELEEEEQPADIRVAETLKKPEGPDAFAPVASVDPPSAARQQSWGRAIVAAIGRPLRAPRPGDIPPVREAFSVRMSYGRRYTQPRQISGRDRTSCRSRT